MGLDPRLLKQLEMLGREEDPASLGLNETEKVFMGFSGLIKERTLDVIVADHYPVKGEELEHYNQARVHIGLDEVDETSVDMLGIPAGDLDSTSRYMIVLSPQQLVSGLEFERDAWLIPVVKQVILRQRYLMQNFTQQEALVGELDVTLKGIPVSELDRFSKRLKPAPYEVSISLDTPTDSVERFVEWKAMDDEYLRDETLILNPEFFHKYVSLGIDLREKMGALARFATVNSNGISVETDRMVLTSDHGHEYHFHVPGADNKGKNIIIYSGPNPYPNLESRAGFRVIPFSDKKEVWRQMLKEGIFVASDKILAERINLLKDLRDRAYQEADDIAINDIDAMRHNIDDLETIYHKIRGRTDSPATLRYLMKLNPSMLEHFVVPGEGDNLVAHRLLPRLYRRESLGFYHNALKFREAFEGMEEGQQVALVNSIAGQLRFDHEQNHTVNRWLYQNHRELCEEAGVTFNVRNLVV